MAAAYGHLDVLQWARAQDPPCPWSFAAYGAASNSTYGGDDGDDDIVGWLATRGCPVVGDEGDELDDDFFGEFIG